MKKYYLLHLLSKTVFGIFYSCSVANMISDGMTIREACFVFFCLTVFTSIFEIPFGLIADKFGRKLSVLVGLASYGIGFGLFAYDLKFSSLAMAFVALGVTFISGADKAWYVSQLELLPSPKVSTENLFLNLSLVERGSMIVGAFIGPYFMVKNPSMVWGITSIVAFTGLFYGLFLPDHHKAHEKQNTSFAVKQFSLNRVLNGASISLFVLILANFFYGIAEGGKGIVYNLTLWK